MKKNQIKWITYILFNIFMLSLLIISIILILHIKELFTLILVLLGSLIVIFELYYLVTKHLYFNYKDIGPESFANYFLVKMISLYFKNKVNIRVKNDILKELDGSYLLILNHVTGIDVYTAIMTIPNHKFYIIANRNLKSIPIIGPLFTQGGMIAKRMFTPDNETVLNSRRACKNPYPIIIFPEGRLTVDGVTNNNFENIGGFLKMMKIPAVVCTIKGGYLSKPKWRKKIYKTPVEVSPTLLIKPDEYIDKTNEELNEIIGKALYNNDFEYVKGMPLFPNKNKAKGLDKVLYYCHNCGSFYEMKAKGNDLICGKCHHTYHIKNDYSFDGDITNIHEYVEKIKAMERLNLDNLHLEIPVQVKIKDKDYHVFSKEQGRIILTNEAFEYRGKNSFVKLVSNIEVIPFSVNKKLETYYDDNLYSFYPINQKEICMRISLLIDLLQERKKK